MADSKDVKTTTDLRESQKARLEATKMLMIEVLDRGVSGILPTALQAVNQDGKCGCNDVCGCASVCGGCS